MTTDLRAKRKWVLERERAAAERLARRVFPTPPVSAWEVIMPLFLIFNHVRRRQTRDWFVANHLVTKQLALEAALDRARGTATADEIGRRFDAETRAILKQDLGDVYAEPIRQRQIEEMELLSDHYLRLLNSAGADFAGLVRDAYGDENGYRAFLNRLIAAETAVIRVAHEFLRDRADTAFVERMVTATEEERRADAVRVFAKRS